MDLSTVLAAFDWVVLRRVAEGRFERRSGAPSWWRALVDEPAGAVQPLAIGDAFPFLTAFLPDAERAWSSAAPSPIASELWTQTDTAGREIHLEATAARVDDDAVLVIARNDPAFFARQLLLQRARELRFTHNALMREIERKDILLHTIIHDLAAPLHSIVGSLSLLRDLELPPAAARWTQIAVEAAARQRQLIQGILNVFVAEQSGAEAPPPDGVELRRAIERAVSELEPVARQRRITLGMHAPGAVRVAADETRLVRVLANLIDNAIRHGPPGTQVSIAAVVEDGSVRLSVEDEGSGVALSLLQRRPFDLVITDVHMPIMNGVALIRAIRADPALAQIPIIVETSDRAALTSPVWRELKVASRIDKLEFIRWLQRHIDALLGDQPSTSPNSF